MTVSRIRNNTKKGGLLKIGFFLYIGFCLFTIVGLKAAVVNLEYELGDLVGLRAELSNEREIVTAQRANFSAMGNVENVAIGKLGMSYADRDKIYFVKRTVTAGVHRASAKSGFFND